MEKRDVFADSYNVSAVNRKIFGLNWCGKDKFEKGIPMLIAKFTKEEDSDGHNVDVYGTAAPAVFFTVTAQPSTNSMGEAQKGFSLHTGSDMGELSKQMAEAICLGMLGMST